MKISLICPVWNTPRALFRDCIDSVVHLEGATEENFEAIFIDDGSSDGSASLLDEAAKDCPYMKVLHQKNKGNCVARNTGIDLATGDYIAFLDCDDYLYKDFLANALETVKSGRDVYQFNIYKRYEKDNPTLYPISPHCHGDFLFPLTPSTTWVYAWAKLIKRSFLFEHDVWFPVPGVDAPRIYKGAFRNYVRGEDNYFCALLSAEAMVTQLVSWFGVVHIQRSTSLGKSTKNTGDNGYLGLYLVYRALWNVAVKRNNDALREFAEKGMDLHWVLADKSRCPKGWEPPKAGKGERY
jgi:glycosyltransferase involved in cell wall biosynthesis